MKKILSRSLAALILVICLTPALLPQTVVIERKAQIPGSLQAVFLYLADLNQFSNWSAFQEMDPQQVTAVVGTGTGSQLTWKSQRMGEGTMTVESIETNKSIRIRMNFTSPSPGTGTSLWTVSASTPIQTEVTWHYEQSLPYFQRFFGLMMKPMLGKHFERSLEILKGRFGT